MREQSKVFLVIFTSLRYAREHILLAFITENHTSSIAKQHQATGSDTGHGVHYSLARLQAHLYSSRLTAKPVSMTNVLK